MDLKQGAKVFWPTMDDAESAKKAAQYGFTVAAIIAVVTAITAFFGNRWNLIDAVLFAVIGFGIIKMSRVAAIAGVSLVILQMIYRLLNNSQIGIAPILALFFINSIRGTFAYHKFMKEKVQATIQE